MLVFKPLVQVQKNKKTLDLYNIDIIVLACSVVINLTTF